MSLSDQNKNGGPCCLWTGEVPGEWLDYNGHMTEHRYLQVFGESSDALYVRLGIDFANAREGAFYTLETHIRHIAECRRGARLWSYTEILGYDEKRLHLYHRIHTGGGTLLATGEHLSIHVQHSKVVPAPSEIVERVEKLYRLRANLPTPDGAGVTLRYALANGRI